MLFCIQMALSSYGTETREIFYLAIPQQLYALFITAENQRTIEEKTFATISRKNTSGERKKKAEATQKVVQL